MKKLMLIILLQSSIYVYSIPISAGGGIEAGADFKSYQWDAVALTGSYINTGVFGFFDFTYGTVNLSVLAGFGTGMFSESVKFNVGLDLLGKYPFVINDRITVFPFLGLEGGYDYIMDFSLNIKAGVGLDYAIKSKLFLRAALGYTGLLLSKVTLDDKKLAATRYNMDGSSFDQGFAFRIGIGYTLK